MLVRKRFSPTLVLLMVLAASIGLVGLKGCLSYRRLYAEEEKWNSALNAVASGYSAGHASVSVLPFDYQLFRLVDKELPNQLRSVWFKGEVDSRGRLRVFDRDVETLSGIQSLESVKLSSTYITDEAVGHLVRLESLQDLSLSNTAVTSECLPDLKRMRSLRVLNVSATALSSQEVASLRKALPGCTVIDGSAP